MTRGNRIVLPPSYSSMALNGAHEKTTTGRGAHLSAAACCRLYEKGRHNAGLAHGEWRLFSNLCNGYFIARLERNITIPRAARGGVFVSNTAIERPFNGFDDIILYVIRA